MTTRLSPAVRAATSVMRTDYCLRSRGPVVHVWLDQEPAGCRPGTMPDVTDALHLQPATDRLDLLADPVARAVRDWPGPGSAAELQVAEIDPELADTVAFCERYGVALAESANCVVVQARRGDTTRLAACVVLATTRADVNGLVRRHLDARKVSFAATDLAVGETGMEYGGITPLGLPAGWPLLLDRAVVDAPRVVVGSGRRRSKLSLPGSVLAGLPGAVVLDGLGRPA